MEKPKFICEIEIRMDDNICEDLEVWRLPNGALVGVDASFVDQVGNVICDPYNKDNEVFLDEELVPSMPSKAKVSLL